MKTVDTSNWRKRQIVFSGCALRLEYNGPDLDDPMQKPDRVVVAFAPFDFPFETGEGGWGSRSFLKRAIPHICVFHSAEDWYQNADFFDAMVQCRDFLGDDIAVTTYGFSMGGYGAILAADRIGADRAVAVSPQFSIDPSVVRFEKRYGDEWAAMGPWLHDMRQYRKDMGREVIVLLDPLHRLDCQQEALFPKPSGYRRCLIHGAGHAGIQAMVEMGIIENLFDLLRGKASTNELRLAYRQNRRRGFRYLRKVGTLLHEKGHPMAPAFLAWAKEKQFRRLIKKWRPFYE